LKSASHVREQRAAGLGESDVPGRPGDIARAVALVASDEAGWITGQSILANAGNAFSI
jgi:NAD(P)-dependent dehydrogenase (short-subunit alcohol dehydrogenase family)